jgi:hypothetical protein
VARHDWHTLDQYLAAHESGMRSCTGFVLQDELRWTETHSESGDLARLSLDGTLLCHGGVRVEVTKSLSVRIGPHGRLQVRGSRYAYHAHAIGGLSLLRYDNGHEDPEEFHRHRFDRRTGEPLPVEVISRDEMPTLAEFLHEIEALIST